MRDAKGKLRCDKNETCRDEITHIDDKGYIYCTYHGEQRNMGPRSCRKLTPPELTRLHNTGAISTF